MRRLSSLLILCVLYATPAFADTVTPRDKVLEHINIRKSPDTHLAPIGQLLKGESLEYLSAFPGWYQVKLQNGKTGYVSKAWSVKVTGDGPLAAGTTPYASLKSKAKTVTCSSEGAPEPLQQYDAGAATKRLLWVHQDHMSEIYCGCTFDKHKDVDITGCGYEPDSTTKNTKRIEWEHMVPAAHMGDNRPCWKRVGEDTGRVNCRKTDPEFRSMEADLYNLQPAIGRLNNLRSNNHYANVKGDAETFGQCDFRIGYNEEDETVVEPPDDVKGDIARAVFYMADRYGPQKIQLDPEETRMYIKWADEDPIDAWELKRDCRIGKIQGWVNPYVQQE